MIDTAQTSPAAGEARLELAVAAAAAERANKPRWIITLGVFALAITVIFTLVALQSRRTVLGQVAVQRAYTQKILDLKGKLETESTKLTSRGTSPNTHMGADLENLARAMEVTLAGPVGDSLDTAQAGMKRHVYNARASNQDPERILRWLVATQTTPTFVGLEITRLVLRPGAATTENTPGWNLDITFGRWEKNP